MYIENVPENNKLKELMNEDEKTCLRKKLQELELMSKQKIDYHEFVFNNIQDLAKIFSFVIPNIY
ncbi:hypothetical protein D3C86_2237550 [compost metagenome]